MSRLQSTFPGTRCQISHCFACLRVLTINLFQCFTFIVPWFWFIDPLEFSMPSSLLHLNLAVLSNLFLVSSLLPALLPQQVAADNHSYLCLLAFDSMYPIRLLRPTSLVYFLHVSPFVLTCSFLSTVFYFLVRTASNLIS